MSVLTLPFPPSVNHYWRQVGGKVLISAEGRAYRVALLSDPVVQRAPRHGLARLSVRIEVCPPDRRRRDLDNVCKALLDGLCAAGLYTDDSQIDQLYLIRGAKHPGGKVVVTLTPMEQERV